ncbi:TonB-dependent receptor [Photobacterium sp. MCCC 1A19761]|uniref:TonB-dependent receptor domain-containing protein n=1 Tax=Photobacterium sp. MCCC 1A19761 TaxID=3115000 RepID=UPI00307CCFD5
MKKTLLAVALAPVCLSSFSVAAQDEDVMVVTANRFEQSVKNVIAPVSVITKEEIDAIQAKSLAEVLRRLPGVQVANQGGPGQNAELYIRGMSSKNVLVLINGVRFGSATLGYANFSAIPLSGVERIEFVRGPRAAVYGSDAVSGVINIITTYQGNDGITVDAGVGSENYYRAGVSAAGEAANGAWGKIAATYETSDGYDVQPTSANSFDKDDDGYRNKYVVADTGKQLNDHWMVKLNGYYQNKYTEFDNPWSGVDQSKSDLYNVAGVLQYQGNALFSTFTLANNSDEAESYGQGTDPSTIETQRTTASWANIYQLNSQVQLGGGLDWYTEDVTNSATQYTETKRDNTAVYLMALYDRMPFQLEGNVRHDDHEAYGGETTWQAGAGWSFVENMRVTASAGTAFKAPTFNELYWPLQCSSWGCYSGNPNLKPEESEHYEVALEGEYSHIGWRVAGYQSDIKNLISSNSVTNVNVGKAEIKGVELTANFATGPLYHDVSMDFIDTEDKDTGKELQRRAKEVGKWNVYYLLDQWQFDLSYLYQGKRYDDAANTKRLSSYSLVDLAASYFVTDSLTVRGRVANLFDKDYETVRNYQAPERAYYLNASYEF